MDTLLQYHQFLFWHVKKLSSSLNKHYKFKIMKPSTFEWTLDYIRIEKTVPAPILATNFFLRFQLYWMLKIIPICNIVLYPGKLIMQSRENNKNPNFGPNLGGPKLFSWILPLLVVRQGSKLSSYAISRNTNEPRLKKMTNY